MKKISILVALVSLFVTVGCCCGEKEYVGTRVEALDNAAWESSKWISVVDAPVVAEEGAFRAADGANWFVSIVKNEKKVVSAKWMATSLGVFDIYVNGKLVGGEALKESCCSAGNNQAAEQAGITQHSWHLSSR